MPALVFDFDGLMIDSEYQIASALVDAVARRGAAISVDDMAHLFGSTDVDHEWEALLNRLFAGRVTLEELEQEVWAILPALIDELPLMPGVIDALDAANDAGWSVGLATGQVRPRLEAHLERLQLRGRFNAVVTRDDVTRGKPAPDIYLAVAGRLGLAPETCLVLEDSLPGCEAALAAGMTVIVCPSRATEVCAFPEHVQRIGCLSELQLEFFLPS